jgi:cell division protein FtsW (lipid II flippase)
MKVLTNLLVWGWALLVLGSLLLTYTLPVSDDPQTRGWARIETFLIWQGAAFVIALVAAALAFSRKERRGTQGWWMGYGPLVGSLFIAAFVGFAVFTAQFL